LPDIFTRFCALHHSNDPFTTTAGTRTNEKLRLVRTVISVMGQRVNPEELRELLKLAKHLRTFAAGTDDHAYIDLFLRAAIGVEERAAQLAFGRSDATPADEVDIDLRGPIDLLC
jgi:hypothetical protein